MVTMRECYVCGKVYAPMRHQRKTIPCSLSCRILSGSDAEQTTLPGMDAPCRIWRGAKNKGGYGRISIDGRSSFVHRVAWWITFGEILPEMDVLHRCDSPPCCNPSHLFLGTAADNIRDMMSKGRDRHRRGETHPFARLTDADVLSIREEREAGQMQSTIAERYGITQGAVSAIVGRRSWAHVP